MRPAHLIPLPTSVAILCLKQRAGGRAERGEESGTDSPLALLEERREVGQVERKTVEVVLGEVGGSLVLDREGGVDPLRGQAVLLLDVGGPGEQLEVRQDEHGDEGKGQNTNTTNFRMSGVSRKTLWVDLRREFENPCPHLKTLSLRRSRGFYSHDQRSSEPTVSDSRGRVVRSLGMAQTLLRPEQVDDLVAQYREGATLVELASIFGVNRRTVATHLTRREVTIRRGRFDSSRIHEAADLYLSGLTLVEVGVKVGSGPQAVRRALASHGVVIRPGGRCGSRITDRKSVV